MLSGRCDDEDSVDKMNQSIMLARIIILKQQRSGDYPCKRAAYTPPSKLKIVVPPYDSKKTIPSLHLPDVLPNIRLFTVGSPHEKFNIFEDGLFTVKECKQVLFEAEGIRLRMDRIFNLSLIHISEPTRPY